MNDLDIKLHEAFPGKVVRKDLLHEIKRAVNVPSFVLEFLLSRYCASEDPDEIEEGKKKLPLAEKKKLLSTCIFGVDIDTLIVYLPILANYRNLCAHEDILYENKTQKAIDDTIYHKLLKIEKVEDEYVKGKYDLFALVIILKQLLKEDAFKNMTYEMDNVIETLNYNLNVIKIDDVLDRMGFPLNWKDLSKIERSIDKSE